MELQFSASLLSGNYNPHINCMYVCVSFCSSGILTQTQKEAKDNKILNIKSNITMKRCSKYLFFIHPNPICQEAIIIFYIGKTIKP
jgi:hypothetical protein